MRVCEIVFRTEILSLENGYKSEQLERAGALLPVCLGKSHHLVAEVVKSHRLPFTRTYVHTHSGIIKSKDKQYCVLKGCSVWAYCEYKSRDEHRTVFRITAVNLRFKSTATRWTYPPKQETLVRPSLVSFTEDIPLLLISFFFYLSAHIHCSFLLPFPRVLPCVVA